MEEAKEDSKTTEQIRQPQAQRTTNGSDKEKTSQALEKHKESHKRLCPQSKQSYKRAGHQEWC